jgi:hypothetical protein
MTIALILISLFAIWNYWRRRVYYRQYKLLLDARVAVAVTEMSKIWGEALAESALGRNDWPEEIGQ